ncbi:MAG: hypothetical protein WBG37_11860 [Desulfobacterales bacterium]
MIDELRPEDYQSLKAYLDQAFGEPEVDGLYWVALETSLYTDQQQSHNACHPLYFAWELESTRLSCELLVRTRTRMRCDCIAMATREQREWIIACADAILEKLKLLL